MKYQNQRGFAPLVIILLVVLGIGIAGGGYVLYKDKQQQKKLETQIQDLQNQPAIDTSNNTDVTNKQNTSDNTSKTNTVSTNTNVSIIPSFKIDGVCSQNDISSQSTDYVQTYSEFKVTADSTSIKSNIKPCETKSLDSWTIFALTEAEKRSTVPSSELMWWNNSITKINSLKPLQCGVIENPGSENKVAILKFKMNAEMKKGITGNGLLSFIQLDKNNNPVKTLSQFISNESFYDITRNVGVEHICDLDKDDKVEIILKDQRYAGFNFWVVKLAENFSSVNLNFVDGLRGD